MYRLILGCLSKRLVRDLRCCGGQRRMLLDDFLSNHLISLDMRI